MKYLSTFSGIGGFELGIEQAYENSIIQASEKTRGQDIRPNGDSPSSPEFVRDGGRTSPTCIGFSEIDTECAKCDREGRGKHQAKTLITTTRVRCDTCGSEKEHPALQIYQRHFPNHKNYGDITTIDETSLPDFELLVGGFPCQSFSIAGKRGGFDDTRGTMFFEIARIVREKQPRLLLLENVKGLLSHDKGNTFRTIISTLDELGYDCQWQVLNSKNHGVPQNRERVFIIGHLRGTSRPEVFPFGDDSEATPVVSGQCSNTLTARYYGGQANGTYVTESELDAQKINQLNQPPHSNDRVYGTDGVSPTLNTMQGGNRQPFIPEDSRIRRLTPVECERLQGFPDGWTEGVSDTQRYKTLGNAVTVNVIRDIISKLRQ